MNKCACGYRPSSYQSALHLGCWTTTLESLGCCAYVVTLRDILIELWLLLSLIEFLALLFNYCWITPLFPSSCFCMDVHWRYSPLPYCCGSYLQQGFLAQEFLCLWLRQSSCGRWNLRRIGIQILWHHRSVSYCFHVQINIYKEVIVTTAHFKAFSAVYFSDVGSAQKITLYGVL